jgi:hypothetical protein
MSPVEIALAVACALMLAVTAGAAVTMGKVATRATVLQRAVDRLCEEVQELSRREAAREVAEEHAADRAGTREADWLITTYGGEEQAAEAARPTASTQQVVSTALGEPLIKVAAFSHGVRQALREEKRAYLAYQVRREYRRRRRHNRARARAGRGGATQ